MLGFGPKFYYLNPLREAFKHFKSPFQAHLRRLQLRYLKMLAMFFPTQIHGMIFGAAAGIAAYASILNYHAEIDKELDNERAKRLKELKDVIDTAKDDQIRRFLQEERCHELKKEKWITYAVKTRLLKRAPQRVVPMGWKSSLDRALSPRLDE